MSTLAEIEVALSNLTLDELRQVENFLKNLTTARADGICTGREAILWWRETEHLTPSEAESFAADLQSARAAIGAPSSRWD